MLSLQAISALCVTGETSSSLMWYPSCRLQHDNTTSHTARTVRNFLQDRNVSVLPWPAKSPDLSHVWDLLHVWDLWDRRVRARAIPPRNVWELAVALGEVWGNISQQELSNLVQSMRRRCTAELNAASGHTRYRYFVQGHIIPFLLVTCWWNLFSLWLRR